MAKTKTAPALSPSKASEALTRRYIESLRKLQALVQKQAESSTRSLATIPQQLQSKARNESIDLINDYIESLRTALLQSDSGQRIEQAIRAYVLGIQRIAEDAQKEVVGAVREYASTLRELPSDVQKGIDQAFADYTAALEETLDQVDIAAISPEGLMALGQSMTAVAVYTRGALGK